MLSATKLSVCVEVTDLPSVFCASNCATNAALRRNQNFR